MEFWSSFNPLFSVSGFFVGLLVGVTGVGGGSLMTPLLVLLFGIHPVTAVGTDLLYAAITKTVGTAVHGKNKTIDWKIVRLLSFGSLPATAITLWILSGVDRRSIGAVQTITVSLGYVLIVTALLLLFRGKIVAWARYRLRDRKLVDPRNLAFATIALGLILGTLVTMTSVGAGAIGVTVLLALYPAMSIRSIVGSDIVHAVPLTLAGGLGYWLIGEVDWMMLASLLIGSVPGIIVGSHFGPRLPDRIVGIVLAITLTLVGVKLITA
ncbi:sulfite exporter TauE/SafE family protein [Sinorhizobium sp. BG8]|uniref:sulfite exporter TauE/SafE family protein n=1 Tax=Sinorhizobium sp. BG8 TaxID=2613773 RepID=UPI00193D051B|nr:sulfite exporter TauE/SafE family protein [Sinorhizobium sp. BG8]QRM55502.1 sulfite exporter TauE/SafE family protein [Sinorhizobium sp. BG8]